MKLLLNWGIGFTVFPEFLMQIDYDITLLAHYA